MDVLEQVFGVRKPVIAMLHFPGLPGRPRHDRSAGVNAAVDLIGRDLEALRAAGVDGMLFCNEADIPYQLDVGPEIPRRWPRSSARSGATSKPLGVNILWDAKASLALARATGASFIREVLTGVYESDLGIIEPHIGDVAEYRSAIGADDVRLFDNIAPEFSSSLGRRSVADRARGAAFLGMDAILISGPAAGVQFEMSDLQAAHDAVGDQVPIIANTGVTAERLPDIFRVADGVIVGTSLKRDGVTWNPIDAERAARLMQVAREARAASPAAAHPDDRLA